MSLFPTPADWYWIVGDDGPHLPGPGPIFPPFTQVFSSRFDDYVPADDATYVEWRAIQTASFGFDPTTRIDTEAHLAAVLIDAGVTTTLTP